MNRQHSPTLALKLMTAFFSSENNFFIKINIRSPVKNIHNFTGYIPSKLSYWMKVRDTCFANTKNYYITS